MLGPFQLEKEVAGEMSEGGETERNGGGQGAGAKPAGKRRVVKSAVSLAAKSIVKGAVGMYDLGAVTSCVGLLRHRAMRKMLDKSRAGAEKALSNMYDSFFKSVGSDEDPVTSILMILILLPMTIPLGFLVMAYAFMTEVCIGTIQVAGIPGILFYGGLRVLERGRPKLKRKIMRVCRTVGAVLIGIGGIFAVRDDKMSSKRKDSAPFNDEDEIFH